MTTPVNQGQYTFAGTLPSVTDATYGANTQYNLADPYIRALQNFYLIKVILFLQNLHPLKLLQLKQLLLIHQNNVLLT